MQESWLNREQDIKVAKEIINRHIDMNEGEPLSLIELIITDNYPVNFQLPDWVLELEDHFDGQYGPSAGNDVMKRVLSNYLLEGAVIH